MGWPGLQARSVSQGDYALAVRARLQVFDPDKVDDDRTIDAKENLRIRRFLESVHCHMEYSHWNDFLLGPAIVSVLFPLAVTRIYKALSDQGPINLNAQSLDVSTGLDQALRFARILMNVGLFWFFWQAWAEKAGYLSNPHSSDEIDLPFEFGGSVLGLWMARVLTKPFDQRSEKFRSTFVIDFVSSGVIGLLHTLIVGPLIEGVAGAVGHSLYRVVPHSLDVHEFTPFQRHIRPLELLLVAGATWWSLNRSSKSEEMTRLGGTYEEPEANPKWNALKIMVMALGVMAGYLAILADVPGAAPAHQAGMDFVRGGHVGELPSRQVLPSNGKGAQEAGR
jgi:hypothetical protein